MNGVIGELASNLLDLICRGDPIIRMRISYKLTRFAPLQSFLKGFALRWWQLNCRFAASSAPKLQYFPPTHSSCTKGYRNVCTGINLILVRRNCPVLDAWGILYALTALVL